MPLTRRITFKTVIQKNNRFLIPILTRWQYKLESTEVLKVTVEVVGVIGVRENFLAKMFKDGRIGIPKLTQCLLKLRASILEGRLIEVTLEPA